MNSNNRHKPQLAARLSSILIFILLVPAGIVAARTLAAEVITIPVTQQLQSAQDRQTGFPTWHWQDGRTILQQALSLVPENLVLLHQLGNACMLQYRYASDSDNEAITSRRQAVEFYRQAIALRPTWPHERVDYLLARFRLQDIDTEFYQQLLLANRLGPWEAWVQRATAEIGLQLDEQLPADVRQTVMNSIINGVQHPDDYKLMLDILRRYNSLDMVCGEVADERVSEYCKRYL